MDPRDLAADESLLDHIFPDQPHVSTSVILQDWDKCVFKASFPNSFKSRCPCIVRLETVRGDEEATQFALVSTKQQIASLAIDNLVPKTFQTGVANSAQGKRLQFSVIEFIEGDTLEEAWEQMSSDSQRSIVTTLVRALGKLHAVRISDDRVQTLLRQVLRDSNSESFQEAVMGGPSTGFLKDGPALLDLGSVKLKKTIMEQWRHESVFCHNDLTPRNIIVKPCNSPDGRPDYQLSAIIDWELAGFYPASYELSLQDTYLSGGNRLISFYSLLKRQMKDLVPASWPQVSLLHTMEILFESRQRRLAEGSNIPAIIRQRFMQRLHLRRDEDPYIGWVPKNQGEAQPVFSRADAQRLEDDVIAEPSIYLGKFTRHNRPTIMSGLEIIGLVSSIISFVDFAAEGVALAQAIAEDGSASLGDNAKLEDRIKRCDNQMNSIRRDYSDIEKNSHEAELVKVTDEYRILTLELMSLLGGLKATRKRDIAFKLFKSSRQKDKKAELQKDLKACRQRVHMQLTLASSADLQQRLEEIRDQGKAKSTEVKLMRDGISELETRMKAWRHVPEFMEQAADILALSKGAAERTVQALILEKLHVADMTRRFDDVKPAHEKTFSWILKSEARPDETAVELDARRDLTTWLSKGRGIFHITGKPGAGKSTLMKLLCQTGNTEDQLKTWAGNRSLIMANFFFYQHGTPLQKSLEGLKQALLCSILEQVPCLVEKVFPQLWSCAIQQMPIEVRPSYVEAAFTELFNSPDFFTSNAVVFFIDGLDEFVGEHQAMIDLLLSWAGRYPTNIKICVSSREWVVFTRAFVHSPKIKLHEITFRDIQSFVRHKLADLISSIGDSIATERARRLIDQIIEKAEGVFLWVRIVVEGLISSHAAGDLMEDLEERVNDLPKELEILYENIFKSMANEGFATRKDRKKAMRMLLATIPSNSPRIPMALIRHSFLEEYEKNRNFALDLPPLPRQIDAASRDQRLENTHKAVYRRCMGLLEVYTAELDDIPEDHGPRSMTKQSGSTNDATTDSDVVLDFEDEEYFHFHVSYKEPSKINQHYPSHQQVRCIHRTVLEFLRQHEVNKTMRADATDDIDFNEGDFHCQSYLAAIKHFRPSVFYALLRKSSTKEF
ncbi:hypothetical protein CCHR01_16825 [Colletotrichum chrysophilum]|uniref:NACHT domain-containing protein n=1 Tax=Colletotrichum chrysophilum TaxID=1836956 RepID=A0AAD9A319_9PEZI|nr:hypothetical protein CCHR01_16825 [Colletotrichum chrysophilum]